MHTNTNVSEDIDPSDETREGDAIVPFQSFFLSQKTFPIFFLLAFHCEGGPPPTFACRGEDSINYEAGFPHRNASQRQQKGSDRLHNAYPLEAFSFRLCDSVKTP